MTKDDLIKKIRGGRESEDGLQHFEEYIEKGILSTVDDGGAIRMTRGELTAINFASSKDLTQIYFQGGVQMSEMANFYEFVRDLSEVLGIYAPTPREVTKDEADFAIAVADEKEDLELNDALKTKEHALGMVEAYEKILLNRDVTVGK